MKKFKFSLQRILDYRESMYDKEKNLLSQLYGERAELDKRLLELVAMLEKISAERTEKIQKGMTAMECSAMALKITGAEKLIEEVKRKIAAVQTKIDAQTEVVIEANKSVKSFENLRMALKITGAEKLIEEVKRKIAAVQTKIDAQTEVVIEANKSVKSFENLREKKLEEYNFEVAKAESERISELISSKLIAELNET